MNDAIQITESSLQRIVRVCLQSVDNIHVRSIRTHGHQLYDTLAL